MRSRYRENSQITVIHYDVMSRPPRTARNNDNPRAEEGKIAELNGGNTVVALYGVNNAVY
jgi:hypothetical protein